MKRLALIVGGALAFFATTYAQSRPILDLDADVHVATSDSGRVDSWSNKVPNMAMDKFNKRDEGRQVAGSGRPLLKKNVQELNGHNTLVFYKQELLNTNEDGCDNLITGNGFTWIAVLRPYTQVGQLADVNSFFGSLKNGGNYEGFWAGFTDDNRLWTGARNGITFGRWDNNNPCVVSAHPLDTSKYYLLAGRMSAGTDTADIELFIDEAHNTAAFGKVPVNTNANSSMLAIGQERDAIQHPGVESFNGELSRFILFDKPLSNKELILTFRKLNNYYGLNRYPH